MTPTFETVFEQAKSLPSDERAKLIEMLTDKKIKLRKKQTSKDDEKVFAELQRIINEQEENPDLQMTKSAKNAEDIRRKNERGYSL